MKKMVMPFLVAVSMLPFGGAFAQARAVSTVLHITSQVQAQVISQVQAHGRLPGATFTRLCSSP